MDEKSNEITAVPELLNLIDVENCIITSDAMSCQKNTVKKINEKNCDYVICLKGNQETLHDDVRLYFETALANPDLYSFVKTKPKAAKELNVPSNTLYMAGLKRRRSEGLISVWASETLKMH